MAEIDRLDIVIATSVKDAKAQITQLQSELKDIKKTLGSITNVNAFKNTGKGASSAGNSIRQQSQKMVKEYSKAAKTMTSIRDKMMSKSFDIPDTMTGAKQSLEKYQKMFATARDKVLTAQGHGENYGKVYRNQVENMYKAAQGIKAARQVINEKVAKDQAYQKLIEEERAAREAAKGVEELAAAYDDVARSEKSYKVKYANKALLEQYRATGMKETGANIGNAPFIKSGKLNFESEKSSYTSLRDTIASAVDSIKSKAQEMRSSVGVTFENMKAKVNDFKLAMREKAVANGILSYTQDFVTLQKSIEKTRSDYAKLTQAMQEYKAAGGSESDTTYKRYQVRAGRMSDELAASQKAAQQMKMDGSAYEVNTKTAQQNLDSLRASFGRVTDASKRAAKSVGLFLLKISGIKGAANKAKSAMNNVSGIAKKLTKELTRVSKMLKLMVTRMALRAIISNVGDGFKSLAIHSEEFNTSMSNLINSAKTLGYSIAGMVSPLINALAPALTYIINLINQAVNALNQLFSALTGSGTWNRAKKFTDSWADSIKGASGAAKELKKTVLGFDELNQLQENKSSGGGAGDIKDMFETVDIDPKWKETAEWLKKMWDNKDFTDLGRKAGERLRDMLESIPWDEIRKTSNDLGKCLATLINGFVEVERLGYDIGHTVAQTVNTVFEFINGFVHNLHWESIGKFIADTFNGFFEGIDWDLIKDTVYTGLEGLAKSINKFVKEFHWDNLSDFISNAINTIVTGIYKFVKKVDWELLGKELGNQLQKTINKIDWRQVGKTIGALIQSAINFCKSFLSQLSWNDIKKAIQDLLDGFFEEVNKEDLAKVISGVLVAAVGIAVAKAAIKTAGMNIASTLFGGAFGTSAMTGVTATASSSGLAIGGAIAGGIALGLAAIDKIKDPIGELMIKLGANRECVENLKEAYSGWDGAARIVKEELQEIWYKLTGQTDKLEELRNASRLLTDDMGNVTKTIDGYGNAIIEFDNGIGTITKTTEGQIKVYDDARSSMDDYTKAVEDNASRIIDIKVGMDDYGKTVSTVSETILPKLGEKTYAASTAQESLSAALADYRAKLDEANNYQTTYKTTLDVIRQEQEKHVKIVDTTAQEYKVLKDDVGKATIVIQDSKPAYEKAGDAAKDATKKTEDYVAKQGDVIKIIPEETKQMETIKTTMNDVSGSVVKSADDIKDAFSEDNWTFSGVAEGLKKTFEGAKEAIKDAWNSIADKVNGEHEVGEGKIRINLPKIYASGGFPEDGLFMANHNELVGKFSNGKTAVANNAQIIEGIERGVYSAVSAAMGQQNSGDRYISNTIMLDGDAIARSITRAQEKENRRYSPNMA